MEKRQWRGVVSSFVLPPILVLSLFAAAISVFILPSAEEALMQKKKDTVRAIVTAATSILNRHVAEVQSGALTLEEGQRLALDEMRALRYGDDGQEYVWLIDSRPRMLMHPFFPEMEGTELEGYTDARGKALFNEAAALVRRDGAGFIDYVWAKGSNRDEVVPKLSYVTRLEPWDWIVGSGIYLDDVRRELSDFSRNLWAISAAIGSLALLLLLFVVHRGWKSELGRYLAETELVRSRERYRALSHASEEMIFLVIGGVIAGANKKARESLQMEEAELLGRSFATLVADPAGTALVAALQEGQDPPPAETALRGAGGEVRLLLSAQRAEVFERPALLYTGRELSLMAAGQEAGPLAETLAASGFGLLRLSLQGAGRVLSADERAVALLAAGEGDISETGADLSRFLAADDSQRLLYQLRSLRSARGLSLAKADGGGRLRLWGHVPEEGGEEALVLLHDDVEVQRRLLAQQELVDMGLAPERLLGMPAAGGDAPPAPLEPLQFQRTVLVACRSLAFGLRVERATAMVSGGVDDLFRQAVAAASGALGPPPCPFALLGLGSIGRGETTLTPDQDTAIIYRGEGDSGACAEYFRRFGEEVTALVAAAGIPPCDAGNSASNPEWCQDEGGWRRRFSGWIHHGLPDDLLQVNIFFDLRTLAGDDALTAGLRRHIVAEVTARPVFLHALAESTINFRLPVDPLGRLRGEGPDGDILNVKKVMLHFVAFVRIYALRHGLEETSTIMRLQRLGADRLLPRDLVAETLAAWRHLLACRFQAQLAARDLGAAEGNILFLPGLTSWDENLLKSAASHISLLQRRLAKDFTRVS